MTKCHPNHFTIILIAEKPIFSIDIHPDGKKFATGGQGNDSGRVVIWNLAPVVNEEAERNKSVAKILCQLDNHLACVNSVRWSCNGQILASGGVDKIIMLWKRGKGPSSVFGNAGITKTAENWRSNTTLRGHSGRRRNGGGVDRTLILIYTFNKPIVLLLLQYYAPLIYHYIKVH